MFLHLPRSQLFSHFPSFPEPPAPFPGPAGDGETQRTSQTPPAASDAPDRVLRPGSRRFCRGSFSGLVCMPFPRLKRRYRMLTTRATGRGAVSGSFFWPCLPVIPSRCRWRALHLSKPRPTRPSIAFYTGSPSGTVRMQYSAAFGASKTPAFLCNSHQGPPMRFSKKRVPGGPSRSMSNGSPRAL